MNAKVVLRVGRDIRVGFGSDYAAARIDAFLTLLQTTSYRFISKLPDNVIHVNSPQDLISLPSALKVS